MEQQTDGIPAGGKYKQTIAPFAADIQAVYQLDIQAIHQLDIQAVCQLDTQAVHQLGMQAVYQLDIQAVYQLDIQAVYRIQQHAVTNTKLRPQQGQRSTNPYTVNLKPETLRDSKNAFLHCGDVLAVYQCSGSVPT